MSSAKVRKYGLAKLVPLTFYLRQNMRQTLIIAWIAAIAAASSLVGFINAYPDEASRQAFVASFTGNTGLKLLLGTPHDIASVGGFVAWRVLAILVLIGGIWGLMLATRLFRGEEQAGRIELLMAGQTTLRRVAAQLAVVNLLFGLVIFILIFVATYASSAYKNSELAISSIAFFALSVTLAITIFMAIGALCGQLFATRGQALKAGAIIYGIIFLLRGMGASVSSLHILEDISPIGWVQNLQAFTGSYWQWLIPITFVIVTCFGFAVWLAGRRDLGTSVFADNDTARPHLSLLNSPLGLWFRLSRGNIVGWVAGIVGIAYVFGTVTKSAGQSFNSSVAARNIIDKLTQGSDAIGEKLFYGMVFLIVMLLVLVMVSGMLSGIREEESEGFLDNMLVRPIARLTVIKDRLLIIVGVVGSIAVLSVLAGWLGGRTQQVNVPLSDLWPATINISAAAILLIGIGIAVYGFMPRLTTIVAYAVIGWAFLAEMLGSVLNLNHWVLDTSLLHHLPLVPAVTLNWRVVWTYYLLGIILVILGTARFTRRDIEAN